MRWTSLLGGLSACILLLCLTLQFQVQGGWEEEVEPPNWQLSGSNSQISLHEVRRLRDHNMALQIEVARLRSQMHTSSRSRGSNALPSELRHLRDRNMILEIEVARLQSQVPIFAASGGSKAPPDELRHLRDHNMVLQIEVARLQGQAANCKGMDQVDGDDVTRALPNPTVQDPVTSAVNSGFERAFDPAVQATQSTAVDETRKGGKAVGSVLADPGRSGTRYATQGSAAAEAGAGGREDVAPHISSIAASEGAKGSVEPLQKFLLFTGRGRHNNQMTCLIHALELVCLALCSMCPSPVCLHLLVL